MNNQNSMEDDQKCALCQALPEDILMLECNHDICVDCALRGYNNKNSIQGFFICGICHKKTLLDKQTIKFLHAATQQKLLKVQSNKSKPQKNSQKPKIPKQPKHNKKVCIQHREQILYYCFDCQSQDICSQCILEQKHSNHNVSTLKKATHKIKDTLHSLLRQKQLNQSKLQNHHSALKQLSSKFKSHIQSEKKQIRHYYQNLKKVIDNQYERILKQFSDSTSKIQNGLLSQISRCCHSIDNIRGQIDELDKGINGSQDIASLKKLKVDKNIDLVFKIDICFPEFMKNDLSAELTKKLGDCKITLPHLNVNNGDTKSKKNYEDHIQQTPPHHFNQTVNQSRTPYNPNQTRIKSAANISNRSFRNSYMQTPLKPQMSRSINTASELINRLQSRQRNFD